MIQFEGERTFTQDAASLCARLRDARFLVECIPDATLEGEATEDRAACSVKPGFSFARGNMELTIQIAEAQEPTLLRFLLLSKGIGSSSDVETTLTFTAQGESG